jgi:L-threonylcarbamoyladenylate synthase
VQQLPIMAIISSCTASTLKDAATSLRSGNLVAFPTETVYGLGADATNKDAVAHLYQVKGRPSDHPLIIHISSMVNLDKWAREIPEYAIKLARTFWPGPMTLILPRTNLAKDFITGNQDNVGLRVPAHPLTEVLLKDFEEMGGLGVAAPSANRFGKVSPTSAIDVEDELSQFLRIKDLILDGGICQVGLESTIIDCTLQVPRILRPGAISKSMVEEITELELKSGQADNQVKASGLLESHYSPTAKVFLTGNPGIGDGFIALSDIETPEGVVRLAAPTDVAQYAQLLYRALRLADQKQIKKVFVVIPNEGGISVAINDRLAKAAAK